MPGSPYRPEARPVTWPALLMRALILGTAAGVAILLLTADVALAAGGLAGLVGVVLLAFLTHTWWRERQRRATHIAGHEIL